MTIGPAPMIRILWMSVRLGTAELFSEASVGDCEDKPCRNVTSARARPRRPGKLGRRGLNDLTSLAIGNKGQQGPAETELRRSSSRGDLCLVSWGSVSSRSVSVTLLPAFREIHMTRDDPLAAFIEAACVPLDDWHASG